MSMFKTNMISFSEKFFWIPNKSTAQILILLLAAYVEILVWFMKVKKIIPGDWGVENDQIYNC